MAEPVVVKPRRAVTAWGAGALERVRVKWMPVHPSDAL
jgi:hypothetical protein